MPLPVQHIVDLFTQEISAFGGHVSDAFTDDRQVFLRSILPQQRDVGRLDLVQGGVALMADELEIRVHPYVFRQVCTNGAIRAHAVQTRRIAIPEFLDEIGPVALDLMEAVQACAASEAFAQGAQEMRTAREQQADYMLMILPLLKHLPPHGPTFRLLLDRFSTQDVASRFDLMNVVTSVARDTPDPKLRWQLEEFGGAVPIMRTENPSPSHGIFSSQRTLVGA